MGVLNRIKAMESNEKKICLVGIMVIVTTFIAVLSSYYVKTITKGSIDTTAESRSEEEVAQGKLLYDADAIKNVPLSPEYSEGLRAQALAAFGLVNANRLNAGLSELTWDFNLEDAAAVRAVECSQKFSHTRPNGNPWYTVNSKVQGGENLAYGYNTADKATVAWMNSPTHKYNIMLPAFKRLGIAVYVGSDGKMYWAQEFGY